MNPVRNTYQLAAAVSNGLAQTQSLGGAGNLTLNGSLVSSGVGTLDSGGAARRVLVTSAGNDSGLTWTITGTDRYGVAQTESLTGGNAVAVYTQRDFLTVTRVRGSAATAGNVTAGTNAVGSSAWFQREWGGLGTMGVLVYIAPGKVVTTSLELTWDDINASQQVYPYGASAEPLSAVPPIAVAAVGWASVSGSQQGEVSIPCFAYRQTVTVGTDPAVLQVIETTQWFKGVF